MGQVPKKKEVAGVLSGCEACIISKVSPVANPDTGWKPVLHWSSGESSALPKCLLTGVPCAPRRQATVIMEHRLPACVGVENRAEWQRFLSLRIVPNRPYLRAILPWVSEMNGSS
jgi:hypothetical protein